MGANLIDTKRRINSINSTKKITKAMQLVASVKLRRWKSLYEGNFEYAKLNVDIIKKAISGVDKDTLMNYDVFSINPNTEKVLYIVNTSDLGLCGSYNYNIFKKLDPILKPEDEILLVGRKGLGHYKNFPNKLHLNFVHLTDSFTYEDAKAIRHYVVRLYRTHEFKSVKLVYTKYINSLTFEACLKRLIPLDYEDLKPDQLNSSYEPIFEPSLNKVLIDLLPHYVDSVIFQELIEGSLCEYGARRNAMESATKNADEINDELMLLYNKARQAQITQEITEVVSGANASKGD